MAINGGDHDDDHDCDDDDDNDDGPQLRPPLHPRRGHGRGRDLGWQQQGLPALLQAAALCLAAALSDIDILLAVVLCI